MSKVQNIVTRFAPSPTGAPHVGSLRNALYNWLFARKLGGEFIVRIEDTDQTRLVEGSDQAILEMLQWVGLDFDGEIIHQSKRLENYNKRAEQLIKSDKAYHCFCTAERLDTLRKEQQARKERPRYDGRCRALSKEEVKTKLKRQASTSAEASASAKASADRSAGKQGDKSVVRLKISTEGETIVEDLVHGQVVFKNNELDDPIILKSDGYPTYHLAHIVDDYESGVTHVIRGEEWLSSLPKHVLIYEALGWPVPVFAHLPLILAQDKSKLSKRHGDVSVLEFKAKGYLPEALLNYVLLLGWHPKRGSEQEVFSKEEMLKEFKLEDVQKSGAIFDYQKLDSMNAIYIRQTKTELLAEIALPFFSNVPQASSNQELLIKAIELEKDRVKTLAELPEALKFVFEEIDYDAKILIWKKSNKKTAVDRLTKLMGLISDVVDNSFNKGNLEKIIKEKIEADNLGTGETLWPLRVALSGQENSPGPFEIAEVLGKDKTLKRLKKAIEKLGKM